MARYTLHLGITWNSPQIGSIWNSAATPYRFLQYAVADSAGAPAWFRFDPGSELDVVIWDLTPSPPAGSRLSLGLSLSFGPLEGPAAGAYNPDDYIQVGSSMSIARYNGQPYLALDDASELGPGSGPWGDAMSYSAGKLVLGTEDSRYKLSFLVRGLRSTNTTDPQSFLSDPEVIVGSTG